MCRRHLFATSLAMLSIAGTASAAPRPEQIRQYSEVVFQNYPPRALAAGEQGPVYFIVKLDDKASPTSCEVTHGSGFPELDAETCALIVQHATFKSLLGPNGKPMRSVHEGVVNWRIPGTPQPPINPIPLTTATAPEKQICKRTIKAGTLAGFDRTCMTQKEWEVARTQTRDHWNELQGRQGASNCEGKPDGGLCAGGPPIEFKPGRSPQ